MKKLLFLAFVAIFAVSCTDEGTNNTINVDGLGEKIDSGANKVWDSTKAKADRLEDKIDSKIDIKDSADRADSSNN